MIEHGFLADVYEPWLSYEGTEWGDQLRALHEAYQMGEDYAGLSQEDLGCIEAILRHHLELAYQDGLLEGKDRGGDEYYQQMAQRAREHYPFVLKDWQARNAWNEGRVRALEEAVKLVPEWMKNA